MPCENVAITNCTLLHGHGGVVMGSEMSGGIRGVVVANCVFEGTDRGIRLKSRRGRGGVIEDIRVANVVMRDVLCPLTVNLHYACGAWGNRRVADRGAQPLDAGTPQVRGLYVSQMAARGTKLAAGFIEGLAEMPLEEVWLSELRMALDAEGEAGYPEMADGMERVRRAGLLARHVWGLRLREVEVTGQEGPAVRLTDVSCAEASGDGG